MPLLLLFYICTKTHLKPITTTLQMVCLTIRNRRMATIVVRCHRLKLFANITLTGTECAHVRCLYMCSSLRIGMVVAYE
uniref:Putative secreted protein n=1 Tax=Anopheles triannulatus TaxID=58253 RepID=A0A2M4B743_9DIPT